MDPFNRIEKSLCQWRLQSAALSIRFTFKIPTLKRWPNQIVFECLFEYSKILIRKMRLLKKIEGIKGDITLRGGDILEDGVHREKVVALELYITTSLWCYWLIFPIFWKNESLIKLKKEAPLTWTVFFLKTNEWKNEWIFSVRLWNDVSRGNRGEAEWFAHWEER